MSVHRTNKRAVVARASGTDRVNVVTSITPELDEAFAALCREHGVTRSALLRALIQRELGAST